MHWHTQLIACAVAFAALGGLWRPGSLALACSWVIGEAVARGSGNGLPISLYWVLDPLVFYIIWRYRASRLDWSILAVFAFQWATYAMDEGATQWWLLYWSALLQMVLAGPWPGTQRGRAWYTHGPLRTGIRHEV